MSARFVAFAALLLLSAPALAFAPADAEGCATAYAKGQEDRLAGRLFTARSAFLRCAAESCPKATANDCQRWASEVEADLPTVRIHVRDVHGAEIARPSVSADGVPIPRTDLARPVILEAGPHLLRVEASGFRARAVETALRPTDRELPVDVVLRSLIEPEPTKPDASAHSRPVPPLAVAFAGVGVLALGSSLYFGLRAHAQYEDLKASCAPNCSESEASSVHHKALAADLSLLVSAAAFGAATWLYLNRGPAPHPVVALSIEPGADGGALRVRLSF